MTTVIISGLIVYGLGAALLLAFMHGAAPPCTCPVTFQHWIEGRRCMKHEEQTAVVR